MTTRINWTASEKRRVAAQAVHFLAQAECVSEHQLTRANILYRWAFFTDIFAKAQQAALLNTPDRIRENIKQHQQVPWLIAEMEQVVAECRAAKQVEAEHKAAEAAKVPDPEVPAKPALGLTLKADASELEALAHLVAPLVAREVVTILATEYDLKPLRVEKQVAAAPTAPEPAVVRKPKVLVFGLLGAQANEVEQTWGGRFDLRFIKTKSATEVKCGGDAAIGLVSFMSHSADAKLKKTFGNNYIRVSGGVSAVKKSLNDLNARFGTR